MEQQTSVLREGLQDYQGRTVQVFLINGGVLKGTAHVHEDWVTVEDHDQRGRKLKASANLDHVVSIRDITRD